MIQREEVIYAVCGREGWGACDFCNVGEDAVKTFENFGVGVREMSSNVPMVWWMGKLGRSLWIRKPWRAFLRAEAIVMTKSGAARVRGHRRPRPPARSPS
jgi:hypothetical protein